ncbi:MAG: aminodeoxychorismate/anthranilate synthase component II [Halieaceae bacterium]|nr:aminodeoxychorismate/anthranilate synthase component II [Halieaceae bacterium]
MIVMIDNYDSFTYNIVQYLRELGSEVQVFRNDEIEISHIDDLSPDRLVISPGPRTPQYAGISDSVIKSFSEKIPILGICLGHQCIGQFFGGRVIPAKRVMHGKTSLIYHNQTAIFKDVISPFTATRYHSLVLERLNLPDCLEVTAWTETVNGETDEIMGLRHKDLPLVGVQFHPESIMTSYGHDILKNFLDLKE